MSTPDHITLTKQECRALYYLIDELSGGNVHHSFSWDGTDTLDSERTSALVKIFRVIGEDVPTNLKDADHA